MYYYHVDYTICKGQNVTKEINGDFTAILSNPIEYASDVKAVKEALAKEFYTSINNILIHNWIELKGEFRE